MFSEVCFGRPKPAILAGFKNLPKINGLRIYFARTTQNYNFMGFFKLHYLDQVEQVGITPVNVEPFLRLLFKRFNPHHGFQVLVRKAQNK